MIRWYTVVGLYMDNRQRFCQFVEAKSPELAEDLVIDDIDDGRLLVCGVFAGKMRAADCHAKARGKEDLCV